MKLGEKILLTKFNDDSSKIVDFLLIVKLLACPLFYVHPLLMELVAQENKGYDYSY